MVAKVQGISLNAGVTKYQFVTLDKVRIPIYYIVYRVYILFCIILFL